MSAELAAFGRYRPMVAESLSAHLQQQSDEHGWQADVAERLHGFATDGKLLRGSLVCYAYTACSGETTLPPAVVHVAAALELAHAALLIHDDIIDQDDVRRNQPALHRQYSQLFVSPGARRPGQNLALCAGDMTLLMAFELLGTIQPAISGLVARELAVTCAGQMQDVHLTTQPGLPSKRTIFAMMRAKTAGYSVALPLLLGATLAEASLSTQRRLYDLGIAAGILFQIRDDELAVFGQRASLGKPVGSDIREGKKTLLYYYLWRASSNAERRHLRTVFGNPAATPVDIAMVRQLMRQYRVRNQLHADMVRLKRRAKRHIDHLQVQLAAQHDLRQLVDFCAERLQ